MANIAKLEAENDAARKRLLTAMEAEKRTSEAHHDMTVNLRKAQGELGSVRMLGDAGELSDNKKLTTARKNVQSLQVEVSELQHSKAAAADRVAECRATAEQATKDLAVARADTLVSNRLVLVENICNAAQSLANAFDALSKLDLEIIGVVGLKSRVTQGEYGPFLGEVLGSASLSCIANSQIKMVTRSPGNGFDEIKRQNAAACADPRVNQCAIDQALEKNPLPTLADGADAEPPLEAA